MNVVYIGGASMRFFVALLLRMTSFNCYKVLRVDGKNDLIHRKRSPFPKGEGFAGGQQVRTYGEFAGARRGTAGRETRPLRKFDICLVGDGFPVSSFSI